MMWNSVKVMFGCVFAIAAAAPDSPASELVVGGAENDRGVTVRETADGGFIVVGVTESAGSGGEDVYLIRLDADQKMMWETTIGGPGDDDGWSVSETAAGGFVIAGFTTSEGAGGLDCLLTATDGKGVRDWSKTYGGGDDDRCWALAEVEGGWVLAGETASSGSGERDCFVIRTDVQGDEVWSRAYGGEKDDRCFSVTAADDGGYVVAGQTFSYGAGDRDAWILKIGEDGELLWSVTQGGEASDVAHSVVSDASGAFLVTGYTTSLAESPDDPMLVKIAGDGTVVWNRVLAMDGHNRTITGAPAAGGDMCLTGFSSTGPPRTDAAIVVMVDGDGRRLWSTDVMPTTRGQTFGYGVTATADGGCAITGHTTVGSAGGLDLFFAKVDPVDRGVSRD